MQVIHNAMPNRVFLSSYLVHAIYQGQICLNLAHLYSQLHYMVNYFFWMKSNKIDLLD